jgi:RimJ/RimL family protein N-acetyltransferase
MLRLAQESDAEDLLMCYSDPEVQRILNSDNCSSDFKYSTIVEMLDCLQSWLHQYQSHAFIRWSIIDRHASKAIGTIEMFGDKERWGILRVDLASRYENREFLDELFVLAKRHFFTLFKVDRMLTKAAPEAIERIAALKRNGFAPVAGREHYYMST